MKHLVGSVALACALLLSSCAGETGGTGVSPCTFITCEGETGGSTATGSGSGGTGMPTGSSGGTSTGMGGSGTAGSGTAGSGTAGSGGSTATGTTCDVVEVIFRVPPAAGEPGRNCALAGACHGDGGEANGALLTGTAEEIAARLLDEPSTTGNCSGVYIDSADPDNSMLLIKTSANHASVCPSGVRMPSLPPVLSADETECLTSWVRSVAAGESQ